MNILTTLVVVSTLAACSGASTPVPGKTTSSPATEPALDTDSTADSDTSEPVVANIGDSMLGLDKTTTITVRHLPSSVVSETISEASLVLALVTALGDGPILEVVPRCLPKVQLTFFAQDSELATLSFCDATLRSSAMRIDGASVGAGTLSIADTEPFKRFVE